jgi:olfactory receptor
MYFLSILSLADICFITTIVPKMIVDIQTQSTIIFYAECLAQMCLFIMFGCMGSMFFIVMSYNWLWVICHLLNYPVLMNPCFCVFLVVISYMVSSLESQLHILFALQITDFKDVEISHIFCDTSQVLVFSYNETLINNIVKYFVGTMYD